MKKIKEIVEEIIENEWQWHRRNYFFTDEVQADVLRKMLRKSLTTYIEGIIAELGRVKKRDCDELEVTGTCSHTHAFDGEFNAALQTAIDLLRKSL